jgi:uncharacterized protein GlcG (DUF336 family)
VAQSKASTAVRFKRPTKEFEDAIAANHLALITVANIIAIRGGLPVVVDGSAVGAIGVSGGDPAQDEQCAEAGLAAIH